MTVTLYDAAGPRARRRIRITTTISATVLGVLAIVLLVQLGRSGVLDPQRWTPLLSKDLAALLLEGLWSTFQVGFVAIVISLIVGVLVTIGRMSALAPIRWFTIAWIEFFRGVPLLVLIFFVYLGAPVIGVNFSTFWSLVLGICLYNSAVIGEIYRTGITAMPRGQAEAAYAIGLSHGTTLRLILFPQAVRAMLPLLVAQIVIILKETSLGFVIGYAELLRSGGIAVEYLGGRYAIPVYTAVGALYLLANYAISRTARRLAS